MTFLDAIHLFIQTLDDSHRAHVSRVQVKKQAAPTVQYDVVVSANDIPGCHPPSSHFLLEMCIVLEHSNLKNIIVFIEQMHL
jgi:hypothetical protein